jgi:branched-chain amino acid aminotransferase
MDCGLVLHFLRDVSHTTAKAKMSSEKLVYLNGKFLAEKDAVISIFDRGFLYGDGVFETMRSYNGRIFKLREHMQRLKNSAERIKLRLTHSGRELADICNELLARNGVADAILRISITRGIAAGGIGTAKAGKPTIAAYIRPPMPVPAGAETDGVSAIISSVRKIPSNALNAKIKSMNFLNLILARSEAEEAGAFEAILLDRSGCITETSTANIFFVRDGRLFTPGCESDILLGIIRATVLELAAKQGIDCREAAIPASEITSFQECFLTNSGVELLPVTRIDDVSVGDGRPGNIYKELHMAYRELVLKAE